MNCLCGSLNLTIHLALVCWGVVFHYVATRDSVSSTSCRSFDGWPLVRCEDNPPVAQKFQISMRAPCSPMKSHVLLPPRDTVPVGYFSHQCQRHQDHDCVRRWRCREVVSDRVRCQLSFPPIGISHSAFHCLLYWCPPNMSIPPFLPWADQQLSTCHSFDGSITSWLLQQSKLAVHSLFGRQSTSNIVRLVSLRTRVFLDLVCSASDLLEKSCNKLSIKWSLQCTFRFHGYFLGSLQAS